MNIYIYIYVIYIYYRGKVSTRSRVRDCFSFLPSIIRLCGPLFFFCSRFVSWPRVPSCSWKERSLLFFFNDPTPRSPWSLSFPSAPLASSASVSPSGSQKEKKKKKKKHTPRNTRTRRLILRQKKVLSRTIDQQHAQREHGNASFTFNSNHNELILLRIVKKQRQIFREKSY